MSRSIIRLVLFFTCGFLLSACTNLSSPNLIAAYQRTTPIARYPHFDSVKYNAYIELQVADIDHVSSQAILYTTNLGGYLVNSQTWYDNGHKTSILELAVPVVNFDSLRNALLSLGNVIINRISSEQLPTNYGEIEFSQITLLLKPSRYPLTPPIPSGWHPGRTFQRALAVFLSIFGFMMDILIWIIVVIGPFLLIGGVTWWLVNYFRQRSSS